MKHKTIYHWGFTVPALLLYSALFLLPVLLNFYYSLTNWNAVRLMSESAKWVGFKNYIKIFSTPELSAIILRTINFGLVTTFFKNILGLFLALLLNAKIKSRNSLRAVFFLPSILSPLIIGLIFGSFFMTNGFFNQLLAGIGLHRFVHPWLTTQSTALGTTMAVEIWRQTGFLMVIYLAGLQMIDAVYYEAADIDGASPWQKFTNVTLPRILPAISVNVLLGLAQGLKAFVIIFVLTNGGPNSSTELISTIMFHEFGKKLYGMSAAYGVIMFVICAFFGLLALKITNRNPDA